MDEHFEKMKKDAQERVLRGNDGNKEFLLYLDRKIFEKGESLDIITEKIKFDQPTNVVFVDDEPGKNFAHRCHYLLYNAKNGEFIRKVPAQFPHFLIKKPETLELFRSSPQTERFARVRRLRVKLELGKLSAYRKIAPFPLRYCIQGRRYAILFSGASNGRHVNDMEFLFRTLIDVYGYNASDIYVLNYDGTINYNQAVWGTGWTEPPASSGFGPDGSPWRMTVWGQGNRAGFQSVINDLKGRIGPYDCLLIHTNNHGGYDNTKGGYLVAYGSVYYASDFVADLAALPAFKTLLVVMEQCHSGSFSQSIMNSNPASNTVFNAAVPWDQNSSSGWPFDPWAEKWISAVAGVNGDGSALPVSPDENLDGLISAREAYGYALSIDNPVMAESATDLSRNVYLSHCSTRCYKIYKEKKEWKDIKEIKESKEWVEPKQVLEPKVYEPKVAIEPKQELEPKAYEPKTYEGPVVVSPVEGYNRIFDDLATRLDRLEKTVDKLSPFIEGKQRPDVKPKAKGNSKA